MGVVVGIYLAESAGLPMRSVASAVAAAGQGLIGDRYQTGRGEWSYDQRLSNDVTLIAVEALNAAHTEHGVHLVAGTARRNLEVSGVDLAALIGRRFRVGEVVLRGERACQPCRYLDRVTGQAARAALNGRGGLRATVLSSGRLHVGDSVAVSSPAASVGPAGVVTSRSDD